MPQQQVPNGIPRSLARTPFGRSSHFCTNPLGGDPRRAEHSPHAPGDAQSLCAWVHQAPAPPGRTAGQLGCCGMLRGQARLCRARHGLAGPGTARQGQARFGKARHGAVLPADPSAPARTRLPGESCTRARPAPWKGRQQPQNRAAASPSPTTCFPPRSSPQSRISR